MRAYPSSQKWINHVYNGSNISIWLHSCANESCIESYVIHLLQVLPVSHSITALLSITHPAHNQDMIMYMPSLWLKSSSGDASLLKFNSVCRYRFDWAWPTTSAQYTTWAMGPLIDGSTASAPILDYHYINVRLHPQEQPALQSAHYLKILTRMGQKSNVNESIRRFRTRVPYTDRAKIWCVQSLFIHFISTWIPNRI